MAPDSEKVRRAEVDRPGEAGVDLPAGKSAEELRPEDWAPGADRPADARDAAAPREGAP